MSTWEDLGTELDRWRDASHDATFWWRDDDATDAGPELSSLLSVAAKMAAPVALAVIPEPATPALAEAISEPDDVTVLQHGYAHRNHEPATHRKCEYGPARDPDQATPEIVAGGERLRSLFGTKALPVFVPPWNRIDGRIAACLPRLGFKGLSTFKGHLADPAIAELHQVNTHVDLVDWRGDRRFRGDASVLDETIAHLRDRRCGAAPTGEPTGIMSHHRIGDRRCLEFLARLGAVISGHAAARWVSARTLFGA